MTLRESREFANCFPIISSGKITLFTPNCSKICPWTLLSTFAKILVTPIFLRITQVSTLTSILFPIAKITASTSCILFNFKAFSFVLFILMAILTFPLTSSIKSWLLSMAITSAPFSKRLVATVKPNFPNPITANLDTIYLLSI